jgi:hypothetical protein
MVSGTTWGLPGAESAVLVKGFSNGRGRGDVSLVNESSGRTAYQSRCPGGRMLLVECRAQSCDARTDTAASLGCRHLALRAS